MAGPIVYLDTNVFIHAFEVMDETFRAARRFLLALEGYGDRVVTSELTLGELLAPLSHPSPLTADERKQLYLDALVQRQLVSLIPISRAITLTSVSLREEQFRSGRRLKLADAIHVSTAMACGCHYMITDDRRIGATTNLSIMAPTELTYETIIGALDV